MIQPLLVHANRHSEAENEWRRRGVAVEQELSFGNSRIGACGDFCARNGRRFLRSRAPGSADRPMGKPAPIRNVNDIGTGCCEPHAAYFNIRLNVSRRSPVLDPRASELLGRS